jgi:adenine-specific DNA-methyltransferase
VYYLGSKRKLLSFIKDTIHSVIGNDLSRLTFCDLFAGTGIVGRTFKSSVNEIISNDLEFYAYALNRNYIGNDEEIPDKQQYIDELNQLPIISGGFIYQNYCIGGGTDRLYFSDDNGKKIDTIRQGIEKLRNIDGINDDLYYFLLASLLESADKLANTTAFYHSYLKQLTASAQHELILEPADFEISENAHHVYNEDANTLIKRISGDVLYLDPPYTERNYGASYHLLNTIALYDHFVPYGMTGLRKYQKSNWCSSKKVENALDDLLRNAQFKYIFLSYNNEGLMRTDTIERIMSKYGRYDCASTDYQRFKTGKFVPKANKTTEHIHILQKT